MRRGAEASATSSPAEVSLAWKHVHGAGQELRDP